MDARRKAADMGRRSVEATRADHSNPGVRLLNLSVTLRARFGYLGEDANLDESIAQPEQALRYLGLTVR
jgi:hypothetical protein